MVQLLRTRNFEFVKFLITRVSSINQELEVKHRTVNCYLKIVYHYL